MSYPKAIILNETQLFKKFNDLREYDLQPPSLADGKDYAQPINREVLHCEDSVNVLIYASRIDSFILCEEFRTGAFFNGEENPFIMSSVAGMVDDGFTPEETAFKEVHEEAGIQKTDISAMTFITYAYSSPGRLTEKTYIYLAEIDFEPEAGIFGLPEEGEEIKTHIITRDKTFEMLDNHQILNAPTCIALNWFRCHR